MKNKNVLLIDSHMPEWMTNEHLKANLEPLLPGVEIRHAPDLGDRSDIVMLTSVRLPPGLAKTLPNLKLVQKLGAGVETMVSDPDLPADVWITRLKPEAPAREIAEYCLTYVLREQQNTRKYVEAQRKGAWLPVPPLETPDTTVGVLGLGHIGGYTARLFAKLGFNVIGWSRSPKAIDEVDCRYGEDALDPLLSECDYVASILPSTDATRGLFDSERFYKMKPEGVFINAGRGDLVDEDGLLTVLNAGHLKQVVLDVFHTEPLPQAHPFWDHPKVTITPHVSGWHAEGLFEVVAENYRRLIGGEPLLNLVDRVIGY